MGGSAINVGHCVAETGTGHFYLTKEMPACKNYNKKYLPFRALRPGSVILSITHHAKRKKEVLNKMNKIFFRC